MPIQFRDAIDLTVGVTVFLRSGLCLIKTELDRHNPRRPKRSKHPTVWECPLE